MRDVVGELAARIWVFAYRRPRARWLHAPAERVMRLTGDDPAQRYYGWHGR